MVNEILEQYFFFEFATIMTINMRAINSAEYTALLMILWNVKVRKIQKQIDLSSIITSEKRTKKS